MKTAKVLIDNKFTEGDISVYLEEFIWYKVRGMFCNDDPHPVYTAVMLWHHFLYDYLTLNERRKFKRGSSQQRIPINIDIKELNEWEQEVENYDLITQ